MMPPWKSYAILTAAAVAAFAAGRMTRGPASGATADNPGTNPAGQPSTGRPGVTAETDLPATIRRLENASLAECEELLAGRKLLELPPLVAEALLQRFSELAPERVADLLFDIPGGGTLHASWRTWVNWLGKNSPDLLEVKLAQGGLMASLREIVEDAIWFGRISGPDPFQNVAETIEQGGTLAYQAAEQLADTDPDLLIRYLAKRLEAGESFLFNTDVYLKLARANPAAMQALIPLLRSPDDQTRLITPLAKVLAGDDPALAVALYQSLTRSRARSLVAMEIADAWAKRDPAAALAWVQANLPEGAARTLALSLCLAPIAESDPMKVLALLPRDKDGRPYQSLDFYQKPSTSSDGFSTTGLGGGSRHSGAGSVRDRALMALMASNPQQALEFVRGTGNPGFPSGSGDWDAVAKGAAEWLGRDPAAALRWIAAGESMEASFFAASSNFAKSLRDVDPEMLRQAAASLGAVADPRLASELAARLAGALVLDDPAAAFRQAGQLPEGLRSAWLGAAMKAYAQADAVGAADAVAQLPEAQRREIHSEVVSEVPGILALAYLDRLPPGDQTVADYQQALKRSWGKGTVENWWSSLGEDDVTARSAALSVAAGRLYGSNPAQAGELVSQIAAMPDAALRMQALGDLVKVMAGRDPDSARALADQPGMDLPEDGLNRMRADLQRALKNQAQ